MIGIDIVSIKRFRSFYDKFQDRALKRYLNEDEIKLSKNSYQTLAGFFAAKEAVSKALGVGIGKELSFHDVIIHKSEKNAPYFTISKKIAEKYAITETSLSITHENEFAIAVAYIKSKKSTSKPYFH